MIPAYLPSHPLASCWEKIKRAEQNIEQLDFAIHAFLETHPYLFARHKGLNEATQNVLHRLEVVGDEPSLGLSVRAGEIVHHLRSSLDHLVWQLVDHSATRQRHTPFHEFPIIWTAKRFRRPKVRRKIQGISGSAATLIESLQPYITHPSSPKDSPLCITHALDIRDKHHGLNVIVGGVQVKRAYVTEHGRPPGRTYLLVSKAFARPSKMGTEIVRMNSGLEDAHVDVNAELIPQIAFDEFGSRQNEPVIPSLHQLCNAVAGTITLFLAEFP